MNQHLTPPGFVGDKGDLHHLHAIDHTPFPHDRGVVKLVWQLRVRRVRGARGGQGRGRQVHGHRGTTIGVPVTGSGTTSTGSPKTLSTSSAVSTSAGSPEATTAPSFMTTRLVANRVA